MKTVEFIILNILTNYVIMQDKSQTYNDGFIGVGPRYVCIEAAGTLEHTWTLFTLKQLLASLVHWMDSLNVAP